VALDDFGSGLSSFSYLRSLPATCLKIDGSFVRDMMENPIDQAVVSAINEVGHVMGMTTIAEYAHSEAIVERLREMGVNYAQGYALGMPKPLEEVS
jgi:Amt family ammonium transporter